MSSTMYNTSEQVFITEFDGEAVLFHLVSGAYYGLDEVGTDVWRMLDERKPVEEIVRALLGRYDVNESRLRSDVHRLLADLHQENLVETT
ncbi:MAG: PqqD family protein [Actinomycetota bacterium]